MAEEQKEKKNPITYHSLAYTLLLKERMLNNPSYTVANLHAELDMMLHEGIAVSKSKKEKK